MDYWVYVTSHRHTLIKPQGLNAYTCHSYCFPTTRVALNGPLQGQYHKSFLRVDSTVSQSIVLVPSHLESE